VPTVDIPVMSVDGPCLVAAPVFDHDLGVHQCVEDLAVAQFIAQLAVEALAVAILPWTARFDVSGPTVLRDLLASSRCCFHT
jgi:hypothetical protein